MAHINGNTHLYFKYDHLVFIASLGYTKGLLHRFRLVFFYKLINFQRHSDETEIRHIVRELTKAQRGFGTRRTSQRKVGDAREWRGHLQVAHSASACSPLTTCLCVCACVCVPVCTRVCVCTCVHLPSERARTPSPGAAPLSRARPVRQHILNAVPLFPRLSFFSSPGFCTSY